MTNIEKKEHSRSSLPQIEGEYTLSIPSQTNNLELIRGFVGNIAAKVGFEADDVSKIELACDEACTNVIKHAYVQESVENLLDIFIRVDEDKFLLIISDQGMGFDPTSIKSPDLKQYMAELKVGGLGIYLMKTLMDDVIYDINPGVRNQVTMVKYFVNRNQAEMANPESKS